MQGLTTISRRTASGLVAAVLSDLCTEDMAYESVARWDRVAPRGMPTRELRHCWYRLEDVTRCAAWLPGRKLNYPFMIAEWLWTFCGRDDVEMLGYYNGSVIPFSDDGQTFWGAYGPRWRNQVDSVVRRLRKDNTCRQAVVCIWRPEYNVMPCEISTLDLPARVNILDDLIETRDVPCTVSMQYMLRHGKLETGVVMRSSDAWLGLPYDLFNFSMLQRAIASELNVDVGALTLYVGSSHLYDRNLNDAKQVLHTWYQSETDQRQSGEVFVPTPPGIGYMAVKQREEEVRANTYDYNVLDDFLPFLTMLDYRRCKDPWMVHESLRPLVLR